MKTLHNFFDSDLAQQLAGCIDWYDLLRKFHEWCLSRLDDNYSSFHEAWDAYITHLQKEWQSFSIH